MASPGRESFLAGAVVGAANSAKGPVSRILSCAVIPLGAALPRTLIRDLPGGFGHCMEQPERAPRYTKSRLGASGRCAAPPGSWRRFPPYLVLLRVGFTLTPTLTGRAVRSYRTISPLPRRWSFRNGERTWQAGPTRVLRFQGGPPAASEEAGRGSRGGIFSVALAVREPSSSRPGRYPAHCPAEFGLSSPGWLRVAPDPSGSDRPVLLPVVSLAYLRFHLRRTGRNLDPR